MVYVLNGVVPSNVKRMSLIFKISKINREYVAIFMTEKEDVTGVFSHEQSYKGKVKTHNYINRQNQSTTGKL
jgi:hypothetical protein